MPGVPGPANSQIHHIASNKGSWGPRFKALFDKAGISLDDAINKLPLPDHVGRHIEEYHQWVYNQLKAAIGNKTGRDASDALTQALERIRQALVSNPRLPYWKLED